MAVKIIYEAPNRPALGKGMEQIIKDNEVEDSSALNKTIFNPSESENKGFELQIFDKDGNQVNTFKGESAYKTFANQLLAVVDGRINKKDMTISKDSNGNNEYTFKLNGGTIYKFVGFDG